MVDTLAQVIAMQNRREFINELIGQFRTNEGFCEMISELCDEKLDKKHDPLPM